MAVIDLCRANHLVGRFAGLCRTLATQEPAVSRRDDWLFTPKEMVEGPDRREAFRALLRVCGRGKKHDEYFLLHLP